MNRIHHFAGTVPFGAALFAAAMALGDSFDEPQAHRRLTREAELALAHAESDLNVAITHQSLDARAEMDLRSAYRAAELGDSVAVTKLARSASLSARASLIGLDGPAPL